MCFIINVYLDKQQNTLKYLKDTKVNLNNVLVIIESLNIKDNDWDLLYPYYLVHMNILWEVANSFGLEMLASINSVSTWYMNNSQDLNSVLDLIFL